MDWTALLDLLMLMAKAVLGLLFGLLVGGCAVSPKCVVGQETGYSDSTEVLVPNRMTMRYMVTWSCKKEAKNG